MGSPPHVSQPSALMQRYAPRQLQEENKSFSLEKLGIYKKLHTLFINILYLEEGKHAPGEVLFS